MFLVLNETLQDETIQERMNEVRSRFKMTAVMLGVQQQLYDGEEGRVRCATTTGSDAEAETKQGGVVTLVKEDDGKLMMPMKSSLSSSSGQDPSRSAEKRVMQFDF